MRIPGGSHAESLDMMKERQRKISIPAVLDTTAYNKTIKSQLDRSESHSLMIPRPAHTVFLKREISTSNSARMHNRQNEQVFGVQVSIVSSTA